MLPDRVSNPGPLTYESGALPIALRGPAVSDFCAFLTLIFRVCIHELCYKDILNVMAIESAVGYDL